MIYDFNLSIKVNYLFTENKILVTEGFALFAMMSV